MRPRTLVCIAICGTVVCAIAGATLGAFACVAACCLTVFLVCVAAIKVETPHKDAASSEGAFAASEGLIEEPSVKVESELEPSMEAESQDSETVAAEPSAVQTTDETINAVEKPSHTPLLAAESEVAVSSPAEIESKSTEPEAESGEIVVQPKSEETPLPTEQGNAQASEAAIDVPVFDYDSFRRSLLFSSDPAATLLELVSKTRKRMARGEAVSAAEQFLWQQLEGNVLYTQSDESEESQNKDKLLKFDVVLPRHSKLYYLRSQMQPLPYGSLLRLLRVEAALNALRFAQDYYRDLNTIELDDIYRLWQRTTNSICGQASDVDTADWSYLAMPWQVPYGPAELGEWAVRQAISEAIESVQVPYRLEARFRCNVLSGDVAIEFNATPSSVFPRHAFVHGLGVIATTSEMRSRESSKYAARMGLLLANHAFRSSPKIRRVWIAAVSQTSSSRKCLYSVCIGRKAFSRVHMSSVNDPLQTLRSLGATLSESRGTLLPTTPTFYLEDKLFCPPKRHDLWDLSERSLPVSAAHSLGTPRVSGLVIHEELPRMLAADDILRQIAKPDSPSATEKSVRAIMDVAHATSDMSVWSAAERLSGKLVEGTLGLDDADALRKELVEGDELNKCVQKAQELFAKQEPHRALDLLRPVIDALDANGRYEDTQAVVYRSFNSFSERVLYNRLNSHDKRSVVLAPDAYLVAHLLMSAAYASLPKEVGGDLQKALVHARKALQIAPLNASANLGAAACLESMGDTEGALTLLKQFLEHAYHPQSVGLAYYRLGSIERQLGNNEVCKACFLRSVNFFPPLIPFISSELQSLTQDNDDFSLQNLTQEALDKALTDEAIPLAPTDRTSFILYDGATASVDAEVFPVAQDLMRILEAYSGDDVLRGIRRSLEHEPDA